MLEARFDWFGFLRFSLAIGALQMMLDRGEQLDWFSRPRSSLEAALAALAASTCSSSTPSPTEQPFIDPRMFPTATSSSA